MLLWGLKAFYLCNYLSIWDCLRVSTLKTSVAFQTYFLNHDQLGKQNFHFRFNLIKFGVDFKRLLLLLLFVYLQRLLHVEITN